MRLSLISELNYGKAIRRMSPLLGVMPNRKIRHSERVGKRLHKADVGKAGVYAGLLHDYLERGGDLDTLTRHVEELGLPPKIVQIVKYLSADKADSKPIQHMQEVLPQIEDDDLRNIVILCKLSDRIDNLKRNQSGKYRRKSMELADYLISMYNGDQKPLKSLARKLSRLI